MKILAKPGTNILFSNSQNGWMTCDLLTRVHRWRVIVISLCVCVCVTTNLCNDLLFKIIGQFVRKYTLALVRDSSDL